MKILILLGLIATVAYAKDGKAVFKECRDFKLQYAEFRSRLYIDEISGPWNVIRIGPANAVVSEKLDCVREVYYRDDKTSENTLDFVKYVRTENEHKAGRGVTKYFGKVGKEIDNYFENTWQDPADNKKGLHSEAVLIDTDDGKTWGLWAICVESTVVWAIYSRYPWIDARVEQKLVEQIAKIEKYGGFEPAQIRGIGQTDCYGQSAHGGSKRNKNEL